ncbi:MAG: hypothetical protein ACR2FV_15730 [Ornithinimicrobium sp.]|uniref:hypothetical protein n=1 Tax=Ornithinimicrobium sp. TaxID=1977084 RepID=UPI003D9AF869
MSTTLPVPPWCARLVEDAAVFPPGLSPVDRAWLDHRALLDGAYAECVGPLLVAPAHAAELARVAAVGVPGAPVQVVLIARAETPARDVVPAITALAAIPDVTLTGLEIAHGHGWESGLQHNLPLAVEVSRVPDERDRALDEVASARGDGHAVIAKLRTQQTAETPVPSALDLAGFIAACRQHDLPFKLTGGVHHAIATTTSTWNTSSTSAEPAAVREHGVVNVLLATHAAHTGASVNEIARLLERTDSAPLAGQLSDLTPAQQHDLRSAFTSYGCCGVLDPLTELADLGLLAAPDPPDR